MSIQTKIKKMKHAYISECHDNYRKPEEGLFNYFDTQELELLKKKIYTL